MVEQAPSSPQVIHRVPPAATRCRSRRVGRRPVATALALVGGLAVVPTAVTATAASTPVDGEVPFEIVRIEIAIDSISPDGQWFAGRRDQAPCVWSRVTHEATCADAEVRVSTNVPQPSMAWAPDSSAVVFSNDFLQRFDEPDVYVLTTDGAFANLTDDGVDGGYMTVDRDAALVDIAASWSRDSSTVYFARSEGDIADHDVATTRVMSIAATGGEPAELFTVPLAGANLVWSTIHEADDGSLLFVVRHPQVAPGHGIWRLPAGAEHPELVRPDDERDSGDLWMPSISGVAPDGAVAFVYNLELLNMMPAPGGATIFWELEVGTGALTPARWLDVGTDSAAVIAAPPVPPRPGGASTLAFPAGPQAFSPDGSRWVGVFQRVDYSDRLLALVDTASGEVLATLDESATGDRRFWPLDPQLTADGTVMIRAGGGTALLVDFGDR